MNLKHGNVPWLSNESQIWDDLVRQRDVRYGGDSIREILSFIKDWDLRVFVAYYYDSGRAILECMFGEASDVSLRYPKILRNIENLHRAISGDLTLRSKFVLKAIEFGINVTARDTFCKPIHLEKLTSSRLNWL